ncbi:lateral signaling target protein 2 homolog isoform X1 [Canis lupus familiaris]|nr:lateral signaling target protein 2 homolog isoform X1 [Canis lupus familiaris]
MHNVLGGQQDRKNIKFLTPGGRAGGAGPGGRGGPPRCPAPESPPSQRSDPEPAEVSKCRRHRHHHHHHHHPPSTVMPKHEFSVDMTCEGCSNAVSRVLNKLGGVEFDTDLPNKKVSINSEHSVDILLGTQEKTGKAVSYLGPK